MKGQSSDLDPRWEAIRTYIRRLLDVEQQQAVVRGAPDNAHLFESPVVRDIVRTVPSSPYCALGKALSLSHRERGIVQNMYARCRGGKCPHCVAYWLEQILNRAFTMWGWEPDTLHRSVFTSDTEWRCSQRAKRLRAAYPGAFLWVRVGYNGVREVFTPGPAAGGEPSEDAVCAVLNALLKAPAAGMRRYGGLPSVEREDTGWHAFELPEGVSPVDACRMCEGALGRALDWQMDERRRGGSFYRRWVVYGLAPEEVDRVREALVPLEEMTRAEYAERGRLAKVMRSWIAAQAAREQDD